MAGMLQRASVVHSDLIEYYRLTSYIVLVAILLHPSLLAYQRFRDGFGLPPGSETSYVMPGLGWLIVVGMCSLLVFLAYELHRWFKYRLWWKYVIYAGDAAMVAIFYHGLRLGSQLQAGWFHMVWWFYGISLIAMLLYKYYKQAQGYQDTKSSSNKAGHENQTH